MDRNGILSLLGLALRGGNLVVGEEPAEDAAGIRAVRLLLMASDAGEYTRRHIIRIAEEGECLWVPLPFSKADLGHAVGRAPTAVVGVTDIGLANAVIHRLAELDTARYASAAARLELKARRAAERKAVPRVRPDRRKIPPKKDPRKTAYGAEKRPSDRGGRPTEGQSGKFGAGDHQYRTDTGRRGAAAGTAPLTTVRKENRSGGPYAKSRPVKKGKGSFRK